MVEPAVTRLMSGTEKGRKRPEPSKTAKLPRACSKEAPGPSQANCWTCETRILGLALLTES